MHHNPQSSECQIHSLNADITLVHFRNKKKAYLKVKVEELETSSEINKVRDL